jgi:uncharacterized LabA/DUF88 family protein
MLQTAVFVDAGYLFAAGSALLWGEKQPRHTTNLNVPATMLALAEAAKTVEPNARLLRIYWYDGVSQSRGPSPEQSAVGKAHNVKLRLGFVNSQGQQKGVDSLIVTDLIDLARNHAISDSLILAGDEDLRVGVQIAQTFGVRVHLLGIRPSRGNQSNMLIQEADDLLEWDETQLASMLGRSEAITASDARPILDQPSAVTPGILDESAVIRSVFARFDEVQKSNIASELEETGSLPRNVDAPLLAMARDMIGRDLAQSEKRSLRALAIKTVKRPSA